MKKAFCALMVVLVVVGCSHKDDGGSDDKSITGGEVVTALSVYRCDSFRAHDKANQCLTDAERAQAVGERVSHWKPDQGKWLSFQLQAKSFVKLYNLSAAELSCLIKNYCQEKIP